jgi:hypothetical protein
MTATLAWMRGRTRVARHAERAAPFRTAQNAADQNSTGESSTTTRPRCQPRPSERGSPAHSGRAR